jgi:glycosyltransferase domain-containing protein
MPLSKLTIVMPTFNRQNYAIRNMEYWSGSDAKLLVLDGSKESIPAAKLTCLEKNIKYLHMELPPDERLLASIPLISTEYVALMGDDDFFIRSALEECIFELEAHPDLVSCMGRALGFSVNRSQIIGYPIYQEMINHNIMFERPLDRVRAHMENYSCSTIYSVVRAPVWRKSIEAASCSKSFPPFNLFEIAFEISVCLLGKTRVINSLLWMRSTENMPHWESIANRPDGTFEKWWPNRSRAEEHSELLESMACSLWTPELNKVDTISHLREAFSLYVSWRRKQLPSFLIYRERVIRAMPKWAQKFFKRLKQLYGEPTSRSTSRDLEIAAADLIPEGCKVSLQEVSEIKRKISYFHSGGGFRPSVTESV